MVIPPPAKKKNNVKGRAKNKPKASATATAPPQDAVSEGEISHQSTTVSSNLHGLDENYEDCDSEDFEIELKRPGEELQKLSDEESVAIEGMPSKSAGPRHLTNIVTGEHVAGVYGSTLGADENSKATAAKHDEDNGSGDNGSGHDFAAAESKHIQGT